MRKLAVILASVAGFAPFAAFADFEIVPALAAEHAGATVIEDVSFDGSQMSVVNGTDLTNVNNEWNVQFLQPLPSNVPSDRAAYILARVANYDDFRVETPYSLVHASIPGDDGNEATTESQNVSSIYLRSAIPIRHRGSTTSRRSNIRKRKMFVSRIRIRSNLNAVMSHTPSRTFSTGSTGSTKSTTRRSRAKYLLHSHRPARAASCLNMYPAKRQIPAQKIVSQMFFSFPASKRRNYTKAVRDDGCQGFSILTGNILRWMQRGRV